jgi:hypothetical protein
MLRRIDFLLDRLNRYFRQRRAALSQPKLEDRQAAIVLDKLG